MDYKQLVANLFEIISRNFVNSSKSPKSNFGNGQDKIKIYDIDYKGVKIHITTSNKNNYYKSEYFSKKFASYSLVDLRNILLLVLPFATNFSGGDNTSVNTLDHVKVTLEYISKEIDLMCDGKVNSASIKLINENSDLINKYDALKVRFDLIVEADEFNSKISKISK